MNNRILIIIGVILLFVCGCMTTSVYNLLTPLPLEAYKAKFVPKEDKLYPPTEGGDIEIFRSVNYMGDKQVFFDNKPARPYRVIGELILPEEWYFESTLNKFINREVRKVGGDAILEYNTYQRSAALANNSETGKVENAFLMKVKAIVIRYNN